MTSLVLAIAPSRHKAALALCLSCYFSMGCGERPELLGTIDHSDEPPDAGPQMVAERPHFGEPELIAELSEPGSNDEDETLTADLLTIIFMSDRTGNHELFSSERESLQDPWQEPVLLQSLNSPVSEITPTISDDGLRLWYWSDRGPSGIWFTTRSSREAEWGTPILATELAAGDFTIGPELDESELRIAVSVLGPETALWDLYEGSRPSDDARWGPLSPIPELNTDATEHDPFIYDGARKIIYSNWAVGNGDLYWAQRPDVSSPFAPPQPLSELNLPERESDPHLASDGSYLFYASQRNGVSDIYQAPLIEP